MIDINIISTKNYKIDMSDLHGGNNYLINIDKYASYEKIISLNDYAIGLTSQNIYKNFIENILETESRLYFIKDIFKNLIKTNKLIIGITDALLIKNIYQDIDIPDISDKRKYFFFIIKDKILLLFINEFKDDVSNINIVSSYYEALEDFYYVYFSYLCHLKPNKFIKYILPFLLKRLYLNFIRLYDKNAERPGILKHIIEFVVLLNGYLYEFLNIEQNELKEVSEKIAKKFLLHGFEDLSYLISQNINLKDNDFNSPILTDIYYHIRKTYIDFFDFNIDNDISRFFFDMPFIITKIIYNNLTNEEFKKLIPTILERLAE